MWIRQKFRLCRRELLLSQGPATPGWIQPHGGIGVWVGMGRSCWRLEGGKEMAREGDEGGRGDIGMQGWGDMGVAGDGAHQGCAGTWGTSGMQGTGGHREHGGTSGMQGICGDAGTWRDIWDAGDGRTWGI